MNFETGEYEVLMEALYQVSIQITIITDSGFNGRQNLISIFKNDQEYGRFTRMKNGAAIAYTHSRTMYLEQDDRISVKYLHTDNQDLPSEWYQGSGLQFQAMLVHAA